MKANLQTSFRKCEALPRRTGLLLAVLFLSLAATSAQTFTTLKAFGVFTNISGFYPNAPLLQGPDGTLYGTTSDGERNVRGTVFKMQPDGSGFTVLKWFTNELEAVKPYASLALSDGTLYGTSQGGGFAAGTVFKVNTDGTDFAVLKEFTGSDGEFPYGGVTLSGNVLYGTSAGGSSGNGTVFKLNTDGTGFTVVKDFDGTDGAYPYVTVSGNVLYGATIVGGSSDNGTIFQMNADGSGFMVFKHFAGTDGARPGALTLSGNTLYGAASTGGGADAGTVFKINTDGTSFTVLKEFSAAANGYNTNSGGANPRSRVVLSGGALYGVTDSGGSFGDGVVFKLNTDGMGFTVLLDFDETYGAYSGGLTADGSTLYGTTEAGGIVGRGTVFRVNADGMNYSVLKQFAYSDGQHPYSELVLSGGTLYGTTRDGGSNGSGTLFKLDADGSGYSMLSAFTPAQLDPSTGWSTNRDGTTPVAGLAFSGDILYGVASLGGDHGSGTVFKLNTNGTGFTVLKSFSYHEPGPNSTNSDGAFPRTGLTVASDVIYGTTSEGGASGFGTLFKLNTDGSGFTVLKHFTIGDGWNPSARLALSGGVLYGAAQYGGNLGRGTLFQVNSDGTEFNVLKHFAGADGEHPVGNLVLSSGVLYGTTQFGGNWVHGAVFRLNTDGTGYSVLKHFSAVDMGNPRTNSDGAFPNGGVMLFGGKLYGTATGGGTSGLGTVFQLKTDGTDYKVLKHFTLSDGWQPYAGLALSADTLYGTTSGEDLFGYDYDAAYGTVFKIDLAGGLTSIPLFAQRLGGNLVLSWTNSAFALQAAAAVTGTFINIPDATSPYTNSLVGPQQFYRLIGN